jgi:hypothetical protein
MTVFPTLTRYVPHHAIDAWLAMGWLLISDLGGSHGFYSVLMGACVCNPDGRQP